MYPNHMNERSPLRILDQSLHGGLGAGDVGVVMSRAGVGKTAFLVQVGLDGLMRDHNVLHVSVGQSVNHVRAWYEALFKDLAESTSLETTLEELSEHHIIHTFAPGTHVQSARIEALIQQYKKQTDFHPSIIILDDWGWTGDEAVRTSELRQLRASVQHYRTALWISAQTHRSTTPSELNSVPPPCESFADLLEVVVFLEPYAGANVSVRVLKDRDNLPPLESPLDLDPDTMRLITGEKHRSPPVALPPTEYTLLSGGAAGAETEFGLCAERWRLQEQNFSFAGRNATRERGLIELSEAELRQGDVSPAYVEAQLRRSFPKTEQFQKMLQSIWHQVATAGEIFVVGLILPDNTVNGGTGWAAELGRHFKKTVHVYDQERKHWYLWVDDQWAPQERPTISRTRFAGTGTRFLSEAGRQAISDLFQDTFGSPSK